jgi:histone H3/H4
MKKFRPDTVSFLLVVILTMFLIAGLSECRGQTQGQDSTYCLPIETARKLVEDAQVKRMQDDLIDELNAMIAIAQAETDSVRASFAAYRRYTRRSEELSQEIIDSMVEQADAWEEAYNRERKKTKWGKWLIPAGVLGGILIGK